MLRVPWLLVAFVPGLLMLATIGLGRLEASLDGSSVSATDVDEMVERARLECSRPPVRALAATPVADDEYWPHAYRRAALPQRPADLPGRVFAHHRSNPEFLPTRPAHRV